MDLSLGEWLREHKAAEYEATLRAEGCESVEVRPSARMHARTRIRPHRLVLDGPFA